MKFLTKFVGECNEKDLPMIKDEWRTIMIERLEEVLERPYRIDVIILSIRPCKHIRSCFLTSRVHSRSILRLNLLAKMTN
jgi:hypothetical protein